MAKKTTTKRIDYRPYDIERMSNKEIRKAYSELRKVAYMRQKRLKKAFPVSSLTGTGKYWRFPFTKDLTDSAVAEALADVSFFLRNPMTTVTAQRERLEELSEKFAQQFGVTIPKNDIPKFLNFLDELRARYGAKQVDSERVAELWDAMQRKNISAENVMKNFSFFLENLDRIKESEIPRRKRAYTARDFQNLGIDPEAELQRAKPQDRRKRRSYKKKGKK